MSEPTSASDPIPPVPPAPSFTYGSPEQPAAPTAAPTADAPAAPDTPAAPAAPAVPPPAYGERLPGYEPPVVPPPPGAAPPAPGNVQPGYPQPGYAQPGYPQQYGVPGYGAPYAPAGPRRRTWDVVLTIVLLVIGLFGMIIGLFYAAILADPALFAEAMAQQGMALSVDTRGAALIIGVSHPVLYLVAAGVSILLLVKKRIAFWVPLTAGVIAAIVFWGTIFAVLLSDPALLDSVNSVN